MSEATTDGTRGDEGTVTDWTHDDVLKQLRAEVTAGRPIVGAGAGTGLSAKAAVHGRADLILVYNSGRFRMAGIGSNAGTLPLGDANAIMMDMGEREILPVVPDVPVIAGVNGTDPTRNMPRFLERVLAVGFAGVINFPTMGIIDGRWRQSLEETGFSYALEVDMIAAARALGLYTMAYTFNDEEVRQMASAGVDVVVARTRHHRGRADRRRSRQHAVARRRRPAHPADGRRGARRAPRRGRADPRRPDRDAGRGARGAGAHVRAGVRRRLHDGAAPGGAGDRRHRARVQGPPARA